MSPELQEVLSIAVKTINYIKKNALHSRCFSALCEGLDSGHLQLLYHREARWLSKGRFLNRLFELRQQVCIFLSDKHSPLADHYVDDCFCGKLAYLSDVFHQLNQLNLSMQGRNSSSLHCLSALLCFFYHSLSLTLVNRVSRQLLQQNRRYETVSKLTL